MSETASLPRACSRLCSDHGRLDSLKIVTSNAFKDPTVLCFPNPLEDRARYSYVRLGSPDQIRILELFPTEDPTSRVRLRVHHADLKDLKVAYTAISYVWGELDPDRGRLVECDGLRAYIQPNLHSALVRIRKRKRVSQFIWADALCIDQVEKDTTQAVQDAANKEKSVQVSMMDRIFSHAEQVIIDLGEEYDDLPVLDRYQAISEDSWASVNVAAGTSSLENSIETLKNWPLADSSSTFWTSFRYFVYRPWFTRVWVIQEYALARSPVFMIGSHFRDEKFLTDAVARAAQHLEILYLRRNFYSGKTHLDVVIGEAFFYVSEKQEAIFRICETRSRLSVQRTFCELFHAATTYFNATNLRDVAYALLGLSDDEDIKQDLYVNYMEDQRDLSLRISQYLVRRRFGRYPLYHCVGDIDIGYASWGFNLTNTREGLPNLIGPYGLSRRDVFNACGPADWVRKMSDLRADGLTVRGWVIDTIQDLMSERMAFDAELKTPSDVEDQSKFLGHALKWMYQVAMLQPLPESEFIQSCWRTVVADLAMPSGGEGGGFRRLREWTHADRCINTVEKVVRNRYKSSMGTLPESYKEDLSDTEADDLRIYSESFTFTLGHKLALSTEMETPCLVPHNAREHDKIVIVQGCQIPFILRTYYDEKGEYYRIVGCVYVHGIMDGEAIGDGSNCMDIEIR
ncbi:hypothetical protein LTR10_012753 [Elasticomyces elasticus]|uniref:Heterokaryon incompatibility domain-containing protein n=1 Tax=Exophiala sideris TaxID=1016849 RepID=A0ABR0JR39_9EURO|nr:hypothetical protein LTR10_012753 [Elasticomyces elasticus]KAK5034630.1 hypothetical protein LTR13_006286 [Exophiala sideris]KAK5040048.1 hypothetical protein LTS07_000544 [Exophiala sideris]KAK5068426.1 hypothetical protein LTR69_000545 [Exophiala sideris]KAK5187728.1 hypothetical protein LTR44_000545 [Eurotiomycetes sp. CCFEE 6388]